MGLGSKGGFGLGGWTVVAGLVAGAVYLHKKCKEAERDYEYGTNAGLDSGNSKLDYNQFNDDQSLSDEEKEDIRRTNTPFHFDSGFTSGEFEAIVEKCAKEIIGIASVEVEGPIVYCKVISAKKGPNWRFRLDFNDYGHYTGNCWMYYEHDNSNIPNRLVDLIRNGINTLNSCQNNSNDQKHDDSNDYQNQSEEDLEENRRRNTPFNFTDGISSNEFKRIVGSCACEIREICYLKVDGPLVYCKVDAKRDGKSWNFRIDFNDYGHLTGNWWAFYESDDPEIPTRLANSISNRIVNYREDYSKLPKTNLQYKESNNGYVLLRVNGMMNAVYLWQVQNAGYGEWADLERTKDNTYTLFCSPLNIGNKYRCIVFINDCAVSRTTVYIYEKKAKTEESKQDFNKLPRVNLQYKEANDGRIHLRVNPKENATYLWQVRNHKNGEWIKIVESEANSYCFAYSSEIVGNQYRCIVFINGCPAYRSSFHEIIRKQNAYEQERYGQSEYKKKEDQEQHRQNERKKKEEQYRQAEAYYSSMIFFEGCQTWDDVKRRYRKLMKEYHPDTACGDEEKAHKFEAAARAINEQYDEQKARFGKK